MTLYKRTHNITFGSLLYGMSKRPFVTSLVTTFITLAAIFFYGIYVGSKHGLMLPFFIHSMTVLAAFAPGVMLRFFLYRRWFEKQRSNISGGMSLTVTLIETTLFLIVMSNGVSAYMETGSSFLFALVMIVIGTIANVVFLVWALSLKYHEKQERNYAIQAGYVVHDVKRGEDDFYNPANYR